MSREDSYDRNGIEYLDEYISPKRRAEIKDEARKEIIDKMLEENGFFYNEIKGKYLYRRARKDN